MTATVAEQQHPPELDLTASTVEEFMILLRRILHASGMTAGQVSKLAQLPRSTTYRFVDQNNVTLPARVEQVERFAQACRLRDDQIQRLRRTWHVLNGTAQDNDPEREGHGGEVGCDTEVFHVVSSDKQPPETKDRLLDRQWMAELKDIYTIQDRRRVAKACAWKGVSDAHFAELLNQQQGRANRARRARPHPTNVIVYNDGTPRHRQAGHLLAVGGPRFRILVLTLLAMAVMVTVVGAAPSARDLPALAHMSMFASTLPALILIPQLGRPKVAPSAVRFSIAGVAASAAGGLTWLATQWPFPALVAGFLVFLAAPLWLASMAPLWAGLTTSRGVFAATVAVWFAALAGIVDMAVGGPAVGAVLAGLLTAAGVLMEALARTMAGPRCPVCRSDDDGRQPGRAPV